MPLWLDVKQSNYLLAFIITIHGLALLSSLMLAVLMPLKLLVFILVCYSLYFHLQRYQQSFYQFTLKHTAEFSWELVHKNSVTGMRILNSSVLSSLIIILHVDINNKHQNLLVCRDAVADEAYRQLLVALKITVTDGSSTGR